MENLAKKVQLRKKTRLGTRMVNLDILGAGLMCKICAQILSLEIRGADQFKIHCPNCFCLNSAYTSDHRDNKNGRKVCIQIALDSDVVDVAVFLECKHPIS